MRRAGGGHTIGELEELFSITRSTMYRALARAHTRAAATEAASPAAGPSRLAGADARDIPGPRGYPTQPRGRIRASTSPIGILTSRTGGKEPERPQQPGPRPLAGAHAA
jgi:hypothetical protein